MLLKLLTATAMKLSLLTGAALAAPVSLGGVSIPHNVWHYMAMPGDSVELTVPTGLAVYLDDKRLQTADSFIAPDEPGTYELEIRSPEGGVKNEITLFVLEPAGTLDREGRINGFRMGNYPENAPMGYIRLDEGHGDVRVSPHFRVGQFLCHQQPDHWPKYLLISSANLQRLELLLTSLNEDGITQADTLFVMSGFRSPFYNTALGSASLSRHMYGDAADVYVDVAPRDGVMDDLNKDGVIDKADADFLYDYAEELFGSTEDIPQGGLGSYSANAVHGPFVHIDGRGRAARWGR